MARPAPLPIIKEKLASRTVDVRIVALWHAAALEKAAVSLAPDVARMFEDESDAVSWHAMRTFMVIGAGAGDATPIVTAQLAKGAPPMLVARALAAIAHIGPLARDASPLVLAQLERTTGHERGNALEALLSIAPDAPESQRIFLESLYDEDYAVSSSVREHLGHGAASVTIDAVIEDARAKLSDPETTPRIRAKIAGLLSPLVRSRPEVIELATSLLDRTGEDCVAHALRTIEHLPRPVPEALVDRVVWVANEDEAMFEPAMSALVALGVARRALGTITRRLAEGASAPPVPGPDGQASYLFRAAAEALASIGPDGAAHLPVIVAWLERVPAFAADHETGWYTVSAVAEVAARMGPTNEAVLVAIAEAAKASTAWQDEDSSGVADFVRKLRRIEAKHAPALGAHLDEAGIARAKKDVGGDGDGDDDRESETEDDEAEDDGPDVPDFPPEREPPPPPRVEPLPGDVFSALADAIPDGEALCDLDSDASPSEIAKAVEKVLARAHRTEEPLTKSEIISLAALWATAVARVTGWTWSHVVTGDVPQICLVSKDHAFACAPFVFMNGQAARGGETTALLLFNMLEAKNLPNAKPGALSFIG